LLRSNSWGECKPCTAQRGTTELCMLMDLQRRTIFSKIIFVKSQKYELGGGGCSWNSKLIFCSVVTAHEVLHLDKWSLA
jgi:hypothetical protein